MAALAGIVSTNGKNLAHGAGQVEEMIRSMRHRGPDGITVRSLPDGKATIGAAAVNLTPERSQCASIAA